MKKFFLSLQFIFRTRFWIMNHPYSKHHDAVLNMLMDKYDFTKINSHTAYLGNTLIWISNYPYAVGIDDISNISRPSRLTIVRMFKKLEKDIIKQYLVNEKTNMDL